MVDALELACHGTVTGALNIGTGVETSVLDVAGLVCAALAAPMGVRHVPPRAGEVRRVCLDSSRAQALLGWRARTSLADGVTQLAVSARHRETTTGAPQTSGDRERPDPDDGLRGDDNQEGNR